jgi:ABC-type transport system involved in multi-copper enzyme maturation permease subunit
VIRFAWLQSRTQTLATAAALAALAIVATITGVHLAHLYASLVAPCQARGDCDAASAQFLTHDNFLDNAFGLLARLAPALIGIFWGAPLLTRELETGTFRLAWTQSISRSRWLLTKLAVVALAVVVLAGALTLMITWWNRSLDPLSTNRYAVFDERSIVPIGYAIFGFALGALIGAVVRRTLPAMAATIAGFVAARIAVTLWVRPHLLTPLRTTMSLTNGSGFGLTTTNGTNFKLVAKGSGPPNSWTQSSQIMTKAGHVAGSGQLTAFVHQYCPKIIPPPLQPGPGHAVVRAGDPAVFQACINQAAQKFQLAVTYLPANRYWTLQWLETGVFFALALAAAAGCYWWVTRRTT